MSEKGDYEIALVSTYGGMKLMPEVRNNFRFMQDNKKISDTIYNKIKTYLEQNGYKMDPEEINERFRYLRYENEENFKPHYDGCYKRPDTHQKYGDFSTLTIIIYLNEGYTGCTRFYDGYG